VDPDYFDLMRIRLVEGRLFDRSDTAGSRRVAIVSESLARQAFPGTSPVGKALERPDSYEIVGVVADVRYLGIDQQARPAVYVPKAQNPSELMCLVIRAPSNATGIAPAVRAAVHAIDPEQPVEGVTTLDRIVSDSIADRRFYVATAIGFGLIALLLAVVGLYSVASRTVVERVKELSIRLALGGTPREIMGLVVRQALLPVSGGVAAGLLIAFWISRLLRGFLFEISPTDSLTYAGALAVVLLLSLMACVLPARSILRLNVTDALRAE
jgi:hypothetical protein